MFFQFALAFTMATIPIEGCLPTKFENKSHIPYIARDQKEYTAAVRGKRCTHHYSYKPCFSRWIKTGKNQYQVKCQRKLSKDYYEAHK